MKSIRAVRNAGRPRSGAGPWPSARQPRSTGRSGRLRRAAPDAAPAPPAASIGTVCHHGDALNTTTIRSRSPTSAPSRSGPSETVSDNTMTITPARLFRSTDRKRDPLGDRRGNCRAGTVARRTAAGAGRGPPALAAAIASGPGASAGSGQQWPEQWPPGLVVSGRRQAGAESRCHTCPIDPIEPVAGVEGVAVQRLRPQQVGPGVPQHRPLPQGYRRQAEGVHPHPVGHARRRRQLEGKRVEQRLVVVGIDVGDHLRRFGGVSDRRTLVPHLRSGARQSPQSIDQREVPAGFR